MSNIEKALNIAFEAHFKQLDKAGEPYILHPIRLSTKFEHHDLKIVSLLHDVIEDSHFELADLVNAGFSENIIHAIDCLTKRNDSYDEYIDLILTNPLAIQVKIEDIKDNLDISRLKEDLSSADLKRITKYHKALRYLQINSIVK